MTHLPHDGPELSRIYRSRFDGQSAYRTAVWKALIDHIFAPWVHHGQRVLDLGTGRGEFINQVSVAEKFAMDLNPETRAVLNPDVRFLEQDCSTPWAIPAGTLDLVFTSNFFEHLPDKASLRRTLDHALLTLRSGGRLIAMGPNIRLIPGGYWDFWDHYLPLSDRSLVELARLAGFFVEKQIPASLPYSMSQGYTPPLWCVRAYVRMPIIWPLFGKQFIVVLRRP